MMKKRNPAFRNNYPAAIMVLVILLSSFSVNAQLRDGLYYTPISPAYSWKSGWFKTNLSMPDSIGPFGIGRGSFYLDTITKSIRVYDGLTWIYQRGVDSIWIVDGGTDPDTLRYRSLGTTYTAGILDGGGGGSQDLQSVTDIGTFTTNPVQSGNSFVMRNAANTATIGEWINNSNARSELYLYNTSTGRQSLLANNLLEFKGTGSNYQAIKPFATPSASYVSFTLPNASTDKTIPVSVTINGNTYTANTTTGDVNLGTVGGTTSLKNAGIGYDLAKEGTDSVKRIAAGTNVTLDSTTTPNTVIINSSGGGGSNTWDSLRVFSVTEYGAKGDNSTNDRHAIQAAINAAKAIAGGVVYFPRGIYRIDSTLRIDTSNIVLKGEGFASQILATGDFGDIIHVAPLGDKIWTEFQGHKIVDLYIESLVERTSGYAIASKFTFNFIIENTKIGQLINFGLVPKLWGGIKFDIQADMIVTGCQIFARKTGVYVSGLNSGSNWDGQITGNTIIFGYKNGTSFFDDTYGVHIAGGNGGMQIEQSNISWFAHGIYVDTSSGYGTNRELFLGHAFLGDDVGGAGIVIKDGSLQILQMTGGWLAGTGRGTQTPTGGLHIEDGTSGPRITITGGTFYANERGHAFYFGGGDIQMTGVRIYDNDSTDVKLGPNVVKAQIVGNSFTTFTNSSSITPNMRANSTTHVNEKIAWNTNGYNSFLVENLSTGNAAAAGSNYYNSSTNLGVGITSTGYTPVGAFGANTGYLVSGGTGGLAITGTAGDVNINTGASHVTKLKVKQSDGYVYVADRIVIGSTSTAPLTTLDIPGFSTSIPKLRAGSLEFQSYAAVNNSWIGENVYYDGATFVRRAAGAGGLFYFQGEEGQFRMGASGSAGASITLAVPFKVHADGRVGIGGDHSAASGNYTGGTMLVNSSGVSIKTNGSTPTAYILLGAGTAATASAPIKFTSGVASQTAKETGAFNYDGTDLTLSDATYAYVLNKSLNGSATLDFGSTAAQSSADLTITVTGAADGDVVTLGVPNGSTLTNSSFTAWVSAANTVTVRFNNYSSGAQDPASGTFKVRVIK